MYVNDKSSMVWALDASGHVFARTEVSTRMPLGKSWIQVIGMFYSSLQLATIYVSSDPTLSPVASVSAFIASASDHL